MALKAENSIIIGLATAAIVGALYQVHLPNTASARASQAGNTHMDSARKTATWEAAGIVGVVSLLAADPTVFIIGGGTLVLLDFAHRFANNTDNVSGKITGTASSAGVSASASVGS